MGQRITFRVDPASYRHWRLDVQPPLARLTMAVDPLGGLRDDYELKLNSYDLSVDIELHDALQRLRFEHPEVHVVLVTGGLDKVFCAGANIQMLAGATHAHKVNFCKFTNETRNAIEEASAHSGQVWMAAVNGIAAGGGYELALACDEILLIDDRSSAVSLPEIPLLAVLPGTGGLTRLVDKRHVLRDRADVFATRAEGLKGEQALRWGLVDAVAPRSEWERLIDERVAARAAASDRPRSGAGLPLRPLARADALGVTTYDNLTVRIDRELGVAHLTVRGPAGAQPDTPEALLAMGSGAWLLAAARELDDAVLDLRFNEPGIGTWVLHTEGDQDGVLGAEELLRVHEGHWLVRELRLLWGRTLKRLDLSSRSLVTLVEPGSCFAGVLAELVLAADRSYMLDGSWPDADRPPPVIRLTEANDGWFCMSNGLSRLESRFWGRQGDLDQARGQVGKDLAAPDAADVGVVTATPDDIDWDEEIRLVLEERRSFSPDALSGLEANLRFVGPETMETKIFARLSAWQNWIFQRPNAVGPQGALQRYGTGSRPQFDQARV
ncbi:MAG: 2,3-epoxybenzoyl-CoA dihydrolase [Acidimicrobiales bacterium]